MDALMEAGAIRRESLVDEGSLGFVRRKEGKVTNYLLVNTSGGPLDRWVALSAPGSSAVLMDAMSGDAGVASVRPRTGSGVEVRVSLLPRESVIVRVLPDKDPAGPAWKYWTTFGAPVELTGAWKITPVEGGPRLPRAAEVSSLGSWTVLDDPEWQRFGGTSRYTIRFKPPAPGTAYALDLGRVCQSARVQLNGRLVGAVLTSPFRIGLGVLPEGENLLEIEVTSTAANRIRDLDRRKVQWKIFHNINIVNVDYKPFDASGWPLHDAGLLGPVRLQPIAVSEVP